MQNLPGVFIAEGTPESVAHSREGGPDSRSRLNLVAGRLTVPNIESRCNQLKLGHPRAAGKPLISLGPALVANSLCPGQEGGVSEVECVAAEKFMFLVRGFRR
jgi:hypothetical protein